jgi:hypothetical protein
MWDQTFVFDDVPDSGKAPLLMIEQKLAHGGKKKSDILNFTLVGLNIIGPEINLFLQSSKLNMSLLKLCSSNICKLYYSLKMYQIVNGLQLKKKKTLS